MASNNDDTDDNVNPVLEAYVNAARRSAAKTSEEAASKGYSDPSKYVADMRARINARREARSATRSEPATDAALNAAIEGESAGRATRSAAMSQTERSIKSTKFHQPEPGGGKLVDEAATTHLMDSQLDQEILNYSGEKAPVKKAINDLQFWMEGSPDNMTDQEISEAGGLENITRDRRPDLSGSRNNTPRPVLRARIGRAYEDFGPTSDQKMVPPTSQEWKDSTELTKSKQNQRAYKNKKANSDASQTVVTKRSEQAAALRGRGRNAQADSLEAKNAEEQASPGSTTRSTVATNSGNDRAYRVQPANPRIIGGAWLRGSNAEARNATGGLTPAEAATVGALILDKNKRIENVMTTPPGGRNSRTTGGGRVGRGEIMPDNVRSMNVTVPLRRLQQESNDIANLETQVEALAGKTDKESVTAKRDIRAKINTRKKKTSETVSTYGVIDKATGKVQKPKATVVNDVESVEPLNKGLKITGQGQSTPSNVLRRTPQGALPHISEDQIASASGYAKVGLQQILSNAQPSGVAPQRSRVYPMYNTSRFGLGYGQKTGDTSSSRTVASGTETTRQNVPPSMSYSNVRALRVQGNQLAAAMMTDNMPKASGGYGQMAQSGMQNAMTPAIEEYQAWRSRNKKAEL